MNLSKDGASMGNRTRAVGRGLLDALHLLGRGFGKLVPERGSTFVMTVQVVSFVSPYTANPYTADPEKTQQNAHGLRRRL